MRLCNGSLNICQTMRVRLGDAETDEMMGACLVVVAPAPAPCSFLDGKDARTLTR